MCVVFFFILAMHKVLFSRIGKTMDGADTSQPPPQRSMSREEGMYAIVLGSILKYAGPASFSTAVSSKSLKG